MVIRSLVLRGSMEVGPGPRSRYGAGWWVPAWTWEQSQDALRIVRGEDVNCIPTRSPWRRTGRPGWRPFAPGGSGLSMFSSRPVAIASPVRNKQPSRDGDTRYPIQGLSA